MTFEQFLQEKHMENYTGVKEGAERAFNNWFEGLSFDRIFEYAEEWKEGWK